MKICLFVPDLRCGGAERVNLDLAYAFRDRGFTVEFVVMREEGDLLEEAKRHFVVQSLEVKRVRDLVFVLARYMRATRPAVFIASMWPLTVVSPLARVISRVPCQCMIIEHNTLSVQYAGKGSLHRLAMIWSMRLCYRLAQVRVAVSDGVADDIAKLSALKRGAIEVINNPVPSPEDPSDASISEANALWPVSKGARILSVGTLKHQKNHPLLMRAFRDLAHPDAALMIVGGGSELSSLESLAQDLGISDRVVFAGHRQDPTPFYRTADLFVLSSRYEGFGNVIIEAMANGLPVVSTDCPSGPSDILSNGKYGALVAVNDVEGLANAIDRSLDTKTNPDKLKSRALDFSPRIAGDTYLKALGL